MTERMVQLEVRFLILRYGRRKVVEALAHLNDQTVDDLDRELKNIAERKPRGKSKPKQAIELVAEACQVRPEVVDTVKTLALRFDNRTFLPQLRDAERFLARTGAVHGRLKSRLAAASYVVGALAALPVEELNRLVASAPSSVSEYSLLAREIMGGSSRRRDERAGHVSDDRK